MINNPHQGHLRHAPKRPLCNDTCARKKFQRLKEDRPAELKLSSHVKMILLAALERNRPAEAGGASDPSVRIQVVDIIELRDFIESNPFWRSELSRIKGCGRAILHEIERYATANGIDTGVSALDNEALESAGCMGLCTRAINSIRTLTKTDVPTFQTLYDLFRENPDWRFDFFCLRSCGWKTMMNIDRFAESYGLLPKTKGTRGRFDAKEFLDEVARRKKDGLINPEKQYPYVETRREGRSEPPATNI